VKERRYTPGGIEMRGKDGAGATLIGHASVFDTPYELYGFAEQVARGAFTRTISEPHGIAALWNHDSGIVLGRDKSGTLRLTEDDDGLRYEIDLPDTQAARDAYVSIERGDVYQSSFAFEVMDGGERWDEPDDERDMPLRTLTELRLYDVSPVTFPASPATDVDVARALRGYAEAVGADPAVLATTFADLSKTRSDASTEVEPDAAEQSVEPVPVLEPVRSSYLLGI
jgi:hypothetical protein